ncbi:MAG TPA: cation:proton antiporter, partial [Candidatus Micrarchaeota archaeon]|nr:cation:proton antiporter [Candidatus Micrarchaeota archaeon]
MDQSRVNRIFAKLYPYAIIGLFALLALTVLRASLFDSMAPEKHIYFEIVFLLLLAVLGEIVVAHFKQPSVMVLMLLGILISPSFFHFAWGFLHAIGVPVPAAQPEIMRSEEILSVFAQLGAIILLFKVGLHSRLEGIFALDNLLVAVSGVIVPFAAGFAYATMSGGNFAYSMFVGAALTATSVGVTVALLKESRLVNQRF